MRVADVSLINFRADETLRAQIKACAVREGITVSDFIRAAVRQAVAADAIDILQEATRRAAA